MDMDQNNAINKAYERNDGPIANRLGILDRKLLEMVAKAAMCEDETARLYARLRDVLIAEEDKKTVRGIMLDDVKHRRQLEGIWNSIAGQSLDLPVNNEEIILPPVPLTAVFEERIHAELGDVEFFRQIYVTLIDLEFRDILFEIITDKQRHGALMCMLFAKYR